MNQKNLSILFIINYAKTNKKGLAPIYCRITYRGKRKVFSTGQFVEPRRWNSKQQHIEPQDLNNVNLQLQLIKQNLQTAFLKTQIISLDFSVDEVFGCYKDKPHSKEVYLI